MSFIVTASGREFSLAYAQPRDVVLSDIAAPLAQINRFTGHCRRPYSVAEHSLLVADIAERLLHLGTNGLMAALMHDAHEAYVGDVSSPVKGMLDSTWHQMEHRIELVVRSAFGLHNAAREHRDAIKQADLIALATERAQLMPKSPTPWPILRHIQPAEWVDLMDRGRCLMTWSDWAQAFKDRADELDFARNQQMFGQPQS